MPFAAASMREDAVGVAMMKSEKHMCNQCVTVCCSPCPASSKALLCVMTLQFCLGLRVKVFSKDGGRIMSRFRIAL